MTTFAETLPTVALMVVDCDVATADIEIVKLTEVAPAGIVTEGGTTTAGLLLNRSALTPAPVAAPVNDTVQLSEVDPMIVVFAHSTLCKVAVEPPPVVVLPLLTVSAPQPERIPMAREKRATSPQVHRS